MLNLDNILALAGSKVDDDLSKYDALPTKMKEALKEELAERDKETTKRAAKDLVALFDLMDTHVKNHVEEIRDMRKSVTRKLEKLDKLNSAKSYGLRTNNFVPLLAELGHIPLYKLAELQRENPELLKVQELPEEVQGPQ